MISKKKQISCNEELPMIYKLIKWFNRNACKDCDYYYPENNVCQSKKCATCGCHPYVNWFDRHFCEPYKAESEDKMIFEIGKTYIHTTGKKMAIIGRLKTYSYGECLIGEQLDTGKLIPVGDQEDNAVNWVESDGEYYDSKNMRSTL